MIAVAGKLLRAVHGDLSFCWHGFYQLLGVLPHHTTGWVS
jgi:hypothetical protein